MLIEGKGYVAPAKVAVSVEPGALRFLLSEAMKRAEFRGYKNRSSKWSRGLTRQIEISGVGAIAQDIRPILCGMLGEYAVSETINRRLNRKECSLDYALREQGDGGKDLEACGQSAKSESLVDRVRRNHVNPLVSSIFAFCEWVPYRDPFHVQILGWVFAEDLRAMPFRKSDHGKWFNTIVYDTVLEPFNKLILELKRTPCL